MPTRLRQLIYIWLRTAQGSRGAPLICGRALALARRLAASITNNLVLKASTDVDDPMISLMGTEREQELAIVQFVGGFLAMGFDLAFSKAQDSAFEDVRQSADSACRGGHRSGNQGRYLA